ncbi:glycosyltransferase [Mycoplasmatota bacterium zrk1]
MRILFLESHPMWIYGLPNGFRDLGHEVKVSGPLTEENIPRMISEFKPNLIITMGWTPENTGKKVEWIRRFVKQSKIPHVYWATEDPTHTHTFTLPLIQKIEPDFVFTICSQRVDYYRKLGIKAAHMDFGFHHSVHCPVPLEPKYSCSIAVVANGYSKNLKNYPDHYRIKSLKTLITPLLKKNIRIDFWGWGWENMDSFLGYKIPKEWLRGYLHYTNAHKVYSSADIILGLQNHPTQLTQRTYEVLASGGFLVTSDTPEVRRLFKHKEDLVVSSTANDTMELITYYLKKDKERNTITKNGQRTVRVHSYKERAKYILKVIQEEKVLNISLVEDEKQM